MRLEDIHNMHVIGVPGRQYRNNVSKIVFGMKMAKNYSKFMTYINL